MADSAMWDREAETFDEAADHGLRDPDVRAAWRTLLASYVGTGGTALDIGCGTGSLSLLLDDLGYNVTGIDSSPRMVELARQKAAAAKRPLHFALGDAGELRFGARQFDLLIGRHILFMLPDPEKVLDRWAALLRPGGLCLLIEGFWHTKVGLRRGEVTAAMPTTLEVVAERDLSSNDRLWGTRVDDERFIVVARRPS